MFWEYFFFLEMMERVFREVDIFVLFYFALSIMCYLFVLLFLCLIFLKAELRMNLGKKSKGSTAFPKRGHQFGLVRILDGIFLYFSEFFAITESFHIDEINQRIRNKWFRFELAVEPLAFLILERYVPQLFFVKGTVILLATLFFYFRRSILFPFLVVYG